jgi:hypothetical protein
MQNILYDGDLRNKYLGTLAHHKHWEIVLLGVLLFNISQNCRKSLLVLLID